MTLELRLWILAALFFAAFWALGVALNHVPSLWRIDMEAAAAVRGQATSLAIVFTTSGRALPLLGIAVASIAIAAATRTNLLVASAIFVAQLLSQGVVELVKHAFQRVRPDAWLVHKELGFSYPSGHATTAIVFFGSWLVFALLSPLATGQKIAAVSMLAIWMVGIDWSRLALGAHYPTDVVGGTLLGGACASALWATLLHFRVNPLG